MEKLRVAIIGQGRSGRDIHGRFFRSPACEKFRVAAVVDEIEERRARARDEYGCACETFADYRELFPLREKIDLVVNASFSDQHYAIARELLAHGFSVLCEKPFAATDAECGELIALSEKYGGKLFVFHQTLFTPAFEKVKETAESGILGKLSQISLRYSGLFRRWDWQTLQMRVGGSLYNSGPHPIGQALSLLDWDENVRVSFARLGLFNTSGDAEDYAKVILEAPNKPLVDIEIASTDAKRKNLFADWTYKLEGSMGTMLSTDAEYTLLFRKAPLSPRPVRFEPLSDANGLPAYCTEAVEEHIENGTFSGTAFDRAVEKFYDGVYDSLVNGIPHPVTPEMARKVIAIIAECHKRCPLAVRYAKEETR